MQKVTTQDMIVLLNEIREQAVVAMVSHGDSEEYDPIMEMLARKVQIINAIAERVNEMTAVEFLTMVNAECKKHEEEGLGEHSPCRGCPFDGVWIYGDDVNPSRAVKIVKRWKEEQGNGTKAM